MEVMMKHVCKFCNKSFPCGRSLGGHMRSHMINSTDGISKKKLPPISNDMDSANYVLRENPKKSSKFSDDENKVCKECGKSFHSWKALFGHMKCHSSDSIEEEDSWDSISESDTEVAVPNKKKRSLRKMKRYIAATTSSSLTLVNNASPCVSEIEHELQEEVAMSLILLSRDMGNWDAQNHEFSDNNSHLLSSTKCKDHVDLVKVKKVKNFVGVPTNGQKREVPSENFGGDDKNKKIKMENEKRVVEESEVEKKLKFECTTCYKSFNSYQALGGHRVSHKKTEIDHMKNIKNRRDERGINEKNEGNSGSKKIKMHECPICFKIFSSGQALGGHKRSHLIAEAKTNNNQSLEIQKPIPEIRNFLDLNLPAPVEEEHVGFQKWWMESSHKHEQLLHL